MEGRTFPSKRVHRSGPTLALAVLLALALVPSAAADHVAPQSVPGPDNHTCSDFTPDDEAWGELKVDPLRDGEYTSQDSRLTVTIDVDGRIKVFDWTANAAIVGYVFVKAGERGHNLYTYSPPEDADTGLTSPGEGEQNQISHVSFCYQASGEQPPACGEEGQPECPPECGEEGQPECPPEDCGDEGQPECPPTCGGEGQPACPPTCGGEGQPECPPEDCGEEGQPECPSENCGEEGQPACPPTCGGEGQPECPPEECGEEGQPECPSENCGGEGQPECPPTCGGEGQPECPPEDCGQEGQPECPPEECGGEGQPECPSEDCGEEGQPACPPTCEEQPDMEGCETEAVCPAGLTATPNQDGTIRLDFEPAQDSDGSVVYRALDGEEFTKAADLDEGVATWEDTEAEPGETYRYTVTSMFGETEAEDCPVAEATAIPDFPTVLAAGGAVGASLLAYAFARRKP